MISPGLRKNLLEECMRLVILLIFSSILYSCGGVPSRHSTHIEHNAKSAIEDSGAFHSLVGWGGKVGFYVHDSASDKIIDASIKAATTWNVGIGRDALIFLGSARVPRGPDLYSSLDDFFTVIYPERNWAISTGKSEFTLATTVWENASDSEKIIKGDIILNTEAYFFFDANTSELPPTPLMQVVDAETILLHEFGHLLGLGHVEVKSDTESVMHPRTFIGPQTSFRTLSAGDIENARTLYQ